MAKGCVCVTYAAGASTWARLGAASGTHFPSSTLEGASSACLCLFWGLGDIRISGEGEAKRVGCRPGFLFIPCSSTPFVVPLFADSDNRGAPQPSSAAAPAGSQCGGGSGWRPPPSCWCRRACRCRRRRRCHSCRRRRRCHRLRRRRRHRHHHRRCCCCRSGAQRWHARCFRSHRNRQSDRRRPSSGRPPTAHAPSCPE